MLAIYETPPHAERTRSSSGAGESCGSPWEASVPQLLVRGLRDPGGPEALRLWLLRFARNLGFYGGRYAHLGHAYASGRSERARPARFLSTAARECGDGAADSWLAGDPAVESVRISFEPFTWTTRLGPSATEAQRAWLDAERARGIGAGIALPVQDYTTGPAYLSLFGVDEAKAARLLEERTPELAFIAAQFHALARTLLPLSVGAAAKSALTQREIECLRLAAIGWTVSRSAEALGIADRTVEFHLANAAGKLRAVNKIHAVAIATSERLIAI